MPEKAGAFVISLGLAEKSAAFEKVGMPDQRKGSFYLTDIRSVFLHPLTAS